MPHKTAAAIVGLAALLVLAQAQLPTPLRPPPLPLAQGPDPSRPFPNHETPPEGWFCSHVDKDPAKRCNCVRINTDPMCKRKDTIQEDPKCKVWCHKDHCHCSVFCDT